MNLGFVQLKFEELHKRMISIEPTCSGNHLIITLAYNHHILRAQRFTCTFIITIIPFLI